MTVVEGGNVTVVPDSVKVEAGITLVLTETTVSVVGGKVTVDNTSEGVTTVAVVAAAEHCQRRRSRYGTQRAVKAPQSNTYRLRWWELER